MIECWEAENMVIKIIEEIQDTGDISRLLELLHWKDQASRYSLHNQNGWEYEIEAWVEK